MGKLKMCLGTHKETPCIVDVNHLYICGRCGTGKTTTVSNIINSIISLNVPYVSICLYTPKHYERDLGLVTIHNPKDTTEERIIEYLSSTVKERLDYYMANNRNGVIPKDKAFVPKIFIFDDCNFIEFMNDECRLALSNALMFGELLGITVIIASQQPTGTNVELVKQFNNKLVLNTTSEVSKLLVGTPIAASNDFYENHKAAYISKPGDKPMIIDLPNHITKRPVDIFNLATAYN